MITAYTRRKWFGAWCTMVRHNTVAFATDMREGVRRPRAPTIAPPVAYNTCDIRGDEFCSTEEDPVLASVASTGTLAEREKAAAPMANTWGPIATLPGGNHFGETMIASDREFPTHSEATAEDRPDMHNPSGADWKEEEDTAPMLATCKSGKRV